MHIERQVGWHEAAEVFSMQYLWLPCCLLGLTFPDFDLAPVWYENPLGVVIRPNNSKHKYRWSG